MEHQGDRRDGHDGVVLAEASDDYDGTTTAAEPVWVQRYWAVVATIVTLVLAIASALAADRTNVETKLGTLHTDVARIDQRLNDHEKQQAAERAEMMEILRYMRGRIDTAIQAKPAK